MNRTAVGLSFSLFVAVVLHAGCGSNGSGGFGDNDAGGDGSQGDDATTDAPLNGGKCMSAPGRGGGGCIPARRVGCRQAPPRLGGSVCPGAARRPLCPRVVSRA